MKQILFFLWISFSLQSQTVQLKGKVIDAVTKQPVSYANISFLDGSLGISSQENGTFNLEIPKEKLQEKVYISCLNYKDTILVATKFLEKTVLLQPKTYELEEIILTKKLNRELEIDRYKRKQIKSSFGGIVKSPWIVTKYFPYKKEYESTPFLKNIYVYFSTFLSRRKAKFRVRLFQKDKKTGKPSEDLIKEEMIVSIGKKHGKVKIDVSKFNIEFLKEGFFIGLERLHIPYNFYEETYTIKGGKKKYKKICVAPNFGATYTKDSMYIYAGSKWVKYFLPQEFYKGDAIQPAISITLTN